MPTSFGARPFYLKPSKNQTANALTRPPFVFQPLKLF